MSLVIDLTTLPHIDEPEPAAVEWERRNRGTCSSCGNDSHRRIEVTVDGAPAVVCRSCFGQLVGA